MDSIPISVLICTYNRKEMLKRALIAYQNQTFRNFEVIVSSDGSSDGTDEIMRTLYKKMGYPLHYLHQADLGFRKTIALNKAIRLAKGDILVFADDDMIPPPRYLESYEKIFLSSKTPDQLLVYSKFINVDVNDPLFTEENIRNENFMRKVTFADRIHLFYWKLKYLLYFRKHHPRRPKLNGANFAVSATAIRAINGMDIEFSGWGYEDDDLRRRLLKNGTIQAEAVCSAWSFNLGHSESSKSTVGHPEFQTRAVYNKTLAYDENRPVRCIRGLEETEEAEILF